MKIADEVITVSVRIGIPVLVTLFDSFNACTVRKCYVRKINLFTQSSKGRNRWRFPGTTTVCASNMLIGCEMNDPKGFPTRLYSALLVF